MASKHSLTLVVIFLSIGVILSLHFEMILSLRTSQQSKLDDRNAINSTGKVNSTDVSSKNSTKINENNVSPDKSKISKKEIENLKKSKENFDERKFILVRINTNRLETISRNCRNSTNYVSCTTIKRRTATIRGEILQFKRTKIAQFLGIRYAPKPKRFQRSKFSQPETFKIDALKWPPFCPQSNLKSYEYLTKIHNYETDEDCLFLNIWTPYRSIRKSKSILGKLKRLIKPRKLLPVVVFIHGGGFTGMGVSMEAYDGSYVSAIGQVVFVTINYRLGLIGFLNNHFEDFDENKEEFREYGKNLGLLDQIEALKWIRQNIQEFGGDPNRITLQGQSAGAISIGLLMLSDQSKNLFHQAILQSGSPMMLKQIFQSDHYEQVIIKANCTYEPTTNTTDDFETKASKSNFSDIVEEGYIQIDDDDFDVNEDQSSSQINRVERIALLINESLTNSLGNNDSDEKKSIEENSGDVHQDTDYEDDEDEDDEQRRLGLEQIKQRRTEEIRCLERLPLKQLEQIQQLILDTNRISFSPIIPSRLLPDFAEASLDRIVQKNLLLGANLNESTLYLQSEFPKLLPLNSSKMNLQWSDLSDMLAKFDTNRFRREQMIHLARSKIEKHFKPRNEIDFVKAFIIFLSDILFKGPVLKFAKALDHSASAVNIFVYQFQHFTSSYPKWIGAGHWNEMDYVFGLPIRYPSKFTAEEKMLSLKMILIWTNFAKNGKMPSQEGIEWPRFNSSSSSHMNLLESSSSNLTRIGYNLDMTFWDLFDIFYELSG
ncbi:hypothetical protein NH340_JMT08885 [Sarcoptes scabiei]|nr:hypothetical protein NH340_JMT08885 [Sarcoptes scabiei]